MSHVRVKKEQKRKTVHSVQGDKKILCIDQGGNSEPQENNRHSHRATCGTANFYHSCVFEPRRRVSACRKTAQEQNVEMPVPLISQQIVDVP